MYFFKKKLCKEGHIMDPSWKRCPVCLAPVYAWLVFLDESTNIPKNIYMIHEGKNKIGTGLDAEVRIVQETISRHHAMLTCYNGDYTITDLSSSSGTFVNNKQISNKKVTDGDIIRLGSVNFKFKSF